MSLCGGGEPRGSPRISRGCGDAGEAEDLVDDGGLHANLEREAQALARVRFRLRVRRVRVRVGARVAKQNPRIQLSISWPVPRSE